MQPAEGIVQLTADLARVVEIGEELRKIRSARQQVGGRFSRPQRGMPTVDGASQGRRAAGGGGEFPGMKDRDGGADLRLEGGRTRALGEVEPGSYTEGHEE